MDYDYYDGDGFSRLRQDEQDFLRLLQSAPWRMARVIAEHNPTAGEDFIDNLREELRRVRGQKFSSGLAKPKNKH